MFKKHKKPVAETVVQGVQPKHFWQIVRTELQPLNGSPCEKITFFLHHKHGKCEGGALDVRFVWLN